MEVHVYILHLDSNGNTEYRPHYSPPLGDFSGKTPFSTAHDSNREAIQATH